MLPNGQTVVANDGRVQKLVWGRKPHSYTTNYNQRVKGYNEINWIYRAMNKLYLV